MKQVQLHCRVCGQRLTKVKTKSIAYQCKAIAEKLQTAFGIDTSGDGLHIHPESMCKCCKLSIDRVISAMKNKVHHRSAVVLFQWEKHSNQEFKVTGVRGEHVTKNVSLSMCEHFHASAKGGNPKGARPTTGRGRIPGVTPNMIIARINSIAPPQIISPEHPFPRPPISKDNLSVSVLNQLECPLCIDILAQPMHVWIVWSLWYVDSTPSLAHSDVSYTTGSYPCLYCLIPNKNMATPLSARGLAPPRSLHSVHTHHQKYLASGGGRKTAQQFYNCICEPIFDIPTEQVQS